MSRCDSEIARTAMLVIDYKRVQSGQRAVRRSDHNSWNRVLQKEKNEYQIARFASSWEHSTENALCTLHVSATLRVCTQPNMFLMSAVDVSGEPRLVSTDYWKS